VIAGRSAGAVGANEDEVDDLSESSSAPQSSDQKVYTKRRTLDVLETHAPVPAPGVYLFTGTSRKLQIRYL
jgi:hypothetical protein